MRVCGIDEAGRGSMLGPLVVAGVSISRSSIPKLKRLGVRDSKRLTPASRERLCRSIMDVADDYCVVSIRPRSIDSSVRMHGLNRLEARYMARVASRLDSDSSYVDSCDVNAARFGREVSSLSGKKVRAYHHADSRFLVVSAASILAKVSRDRSIARLQKEYDVGSGYPSDPRTVRFVADFYRDNCSLPSFVRKSWKPAQRILSLAPLQAP